MSASFRFAFVACAPLIAALTFGSRDADAFLCQPIPYYRFVGDTASDAMCTDNDIQSAINNASCPGTTIVITRERVYTAQHLTISNKSLTLYAVGDGVPCGPPPPFCDPNIGGCNNPPPTQPQVTLDGIGQTGNSTLHIDGTSYVTLRFLHVTGGNVSDRGGGIYFSGAGSLMLDTTTVDHNSAGNGGGISFSGSGGNATLTLLGNTLVLENAIGAGGSGGGILVEGSARLFALKDRTLIGYNHAPGGFGGGIAVIGPARADIGSPGYNGGAAIQFNDAAYGGGIAASAVHDRQSVNVRLFTVDPANPVHIQNNTASRTGGGIYLKPLNNSSGDFGEATLCAFDFRIDDNKAQEGAAIYADTDIDTSVGIDFGGEVYMNIDSHPGCNMPESPPSLGAVACAHGVPCNTVSGNIAEDSNNTPTPGSAILVQDDGSFKVNRLLMRGNQGAHAIRTFGLDSSFGTAYVYNCLVADNQVTGELVRIDNDGSYVGPTAFANCTFANNTIGGSTVIYSGHDLSLTDMIFDQPGVPTLAYAGNPANLAVHYVLTNSNGTLPSQPDIVVGRPSFLSAATGDYHLLPTSLGVDFAPAAGGTDLDRRPRDVDLPTIRNVYGPRDLGAYERQSAFACDDNANALFCDGFDM
ncbi:hypothetical protein [Dokdonella soli]|uniref:CSLREA domain-containing protein n=1 Tax=Dokdonella soli TaxID=529810 RepID=A0ABN1IQK0_9GAMM